jgi:hypothetical protein
MLLTILLAKFPTDWAKNIELKWQKNCFLGPIERLNIFGLEKSIRYWCWHLLTVFLVIYFSSAFHSFPALLSISSSFLIFFLFFSLFLRLSKWIVGPLRFFIHPNLSRILISSHAEYIGCATHFHFCSKRGQCERKPFRLEPKTMSSEACAP